MGFLNPLWLLLGAAVAICVPIGLWMRRSQTEPIALG